MSHFFERVISCRGKDKNNAKGQAMTECVQLFVYGTLAPGKPNEHVLAPLEGNWSSATVRGHLHMVGWGADMGFPAIDLDTDGPAIEGWIFASDGLTDFWSKLDAFEGEAYRRVRTQATRESGEQTEVYVYVASRPPA